jgi:hypothetical protein
MVDMAAAQNDGIYDQEVSTSASSPTSFAQWCAEELVPVLRA